VLENGNGTAPGLWIATESAAILLLPGPPREMTPMLDEVVRERLAAAAGGAALFRRVPRITGRTESDVDACAQPVYAKWLTQPIPIATTILAASGQIELHLTARSTNRGAAEAALDAAVIELRQCLGEAVYSVDGQPLEAVVGGLLRERQLTHAVPQTCTGGLLISPNTHNSGSSQFLEGGFVCYSNRAKIEWLGVPASLIADHGAVSEPVAAAMAAGARARSGAAIGVGITGIAGPGGGTPQKPVGTVAIAVNRDEGSHVRLFAFRGGRELVKSQAATAALNMLRLQLA
jgi:nicotinamide-nucleotide amidase